MLYIGFLLEIKWRSLPSKHSVTCDKDNMKDHLQNGRRCWLTANTWEVSIVIPSNAKVQFVCAENEVFLEASPKLRCELCQELWNITSISTSVSKCMTSFLSGPSVTPSLSIYKMDLLLSKPNSTKNQTLHYPVNFQLRDKMRERAKYTSWTQQLTSVQKAAQMI